MNAIEEAYAAIPGYAKNLAAQKRIAERERELRTWKRADVPTAADIADMALADEDFPESVSLQEAQAMEEAKAVMGELRIYANAGKDLQARAKSLMTMHAPAALAILEKHLQRLQREVLQCAAALGHARTQADAYATRNDSVIEAWEALGALNAQYRAIREAQATFYSASCPAERKPDLPKVALYANSLDTLEYWQKRRRHANDSTPEGPGNKVDAFCTWLRGFADLPIVDRAGFAPRIEPHELITICQRGQLWAPTLDTALEIMSAGRTITAPAVALNELANRENARDRIYDLTGTTPKTRYANQSNGQMPTKSRHARSVTL